MEYKLKADLSVNITISDDDFAILEEAAAKHYDSTVNMTIKPGGHLFGAKNVRTEFSPWCKEVEFSIHELDLTCKSLEFYYPTKAAHNLYILLIKILRNLIEEDFKLNESFTTQKVILSDFEKNMP